MQSIRRQPRLLREGTVEVDSLIRKLAVSGNATFSRSNATLAGRCTAWSIALTAGTSARKLMRGRQPRSSARYALVLSKYHRTKTQMPFSRSTQNRWPSLPERLLDQCKCRCHFSWHGPSTKFEQTLTYNYFDRTATPRTIPRS